MPEFNFPTKDDPDFADKVVGLIKQLFESKDKSTIDYNPIEDPQEGTQVGSTWYDSATNTLKVMTAGGVKTVTFDP